jgi:hypothetical protein
MAPAALSSASDDGGGGLECAQDRAPLSWPNKRADTLSVCGLGRKAAASSAIRASGASNQTLREQLENRQSARCRRSRCGRNSCCRRQRIDRVLRTRRAGCRAVHLGHIERVDGLAGERIDVGRSDR